MESMGIHALIELLVYLVTVGLSFYMIKAIAYERIIRPNHIREARIFLVFSAIALGFIVGKFIIMLMDNSLALRLLFF